MTKEQIQKIHENFTKKIMMLTQRANDLSINVYYIKEIYANQNTSLLKKYNLYFRDFLDTNAKAAMFEIFNLFDNGKDCFSLNKLKNDAIKNFDVLRNSTSSTSNYKEYYLSKQKLELLLNARLNNISQIVAKIQDARNKHGLGHGMFIPDLSEEEKIQKDEIVEVDNKVHEFLDLIFKAFYNREYPTMEKKISKPTLKDLVKDFEQLK